MAADPPLNVGDTGTLAMLSLCAGGLLRTWTDSGSSGLWTVEEAELLHGIQGSGVIGRSVREGGRFREVGLLSDDNHTLILQPRFPTTGEGDHLEFEATLLTLEPAREASDSVYGDVRQLLERAVRHVVANSEFLVVERGGWDAPVEPYCLFIVAEQNGEWLSVVEAAPQPRGAASWEPHAVPGSPGLTLTAPASQKHIDAAPLLILEAIATWGLEPWDLALTFGHR